MSIHPEEVAWSRGQRQGSGWGASRVNSGNSAHVPHVLTQFCDQGLNSRP